MKVHVLEKELWIHRTPAQLFPFFGDASNLQILTPPYLHFEILTPLPIEMRKGAIIDYRLRLHRIPIRWRTGITAWEPPDLFVDTQIRGPYRRWIHTHRFVEREGGTLATDRVEYAAAGGWPVHRWFVRPRVEEIFAFRAAVLKGMFKPTAPSTATPMPPPSRPPAPCKD